MLAERYHWTPAQVDALDPEYVDELELFLKAERDQQKAEQKAQRAR